ncbi:FAD-binding protein [Sandaracinobacteroides saxicola]|uniref:FAD-binding protein n=1 Tax=Sandaracinobacteroides saxicola TaxID=2759707 RepID=A0A7G5IK54_9SPHN|nr:FAD-binding protein [Sandaracinobacteroides saxicola]QMW23746.1 FAD-binding protein [Sandaracinobacteroides saxicola]
MQTMNAPTVYFNDATGDDAPGAHVPLLVAGGGAAGWAAALSAAARGIGVAVVEQDARCLGLTSMSQGNAAAAGTRSQRAAGVADDAAAFLADIEAKSAGTACPVISRLVAENGGPCLDWLADEGVRLDFDAGWAPAFGHRTARLHAPPSKTGVELLAMLEAAAVRHGAMLLNEARLAALWVNDGRVRAVGIVRPDGAREVIGCDALVLATSGFNANPTLIARHIPAMAQARVHGWEGDRGDALLLGEALGAMTGDLDSYQGLGMLADPHGIIVNLQLCVAGGIVVNDAGERFQNEVEDVSGAGARVAAQGGAWVVFDARQAAAAEGYPEFAELRALGALREVSRLRLPALAATLAAAEAVHRGERDDPFGRRFEVPPPRGAMQAIRVTGALFHTQGGLQIDARARVVRADGGVFDNLFAAGGAARGISGRGGSGYLPAAGIGHALTTGWVAGRAVRV